MWFTNADIQQNTCIVFDLEFIGDITESPQNCHIWEIGAVCMDTKLSYNCAVMPQLNAVDIDSAFDNGNEITHAKLTSMHAIPPQEAMMQFIQWINYNRKVTNKDGVILMAHGCFRADAIVMNQTMCTYKISFPFPVFYFDTLLYVRYAFRGRELSDYSLGSILAHIAPNTQKNTHRALDDAKALESIIQTDQMKISGLVIVPHTLSTTVIDNVGVATARALCRADVTCVESIVRATRTQNISLRDFWMNCGVILHATPEAMAVATSDAIGRFMV